MAFRAGLLLLGAISTVAAETVHGVVIFTRHGDRTSKHYSGYNLTNLGLQQNHMVGGDYRARYLDANSPQRILGISEDKYRSSQIYASAPDQLVLLNTATAFLQGLYPPLVDTNPELATQTLNNNTEYDSPLNGYQYVLLHGEDANSPDSMWIKGDDGCPTLNTASSDFENSTEFKTQVDSTKPFYEKFWDILDAVYDYQESNLTYKKAYDIFDLINVASIHNKTSAAANISTDDLFQLRTLADSAEWGYNYNASNPARAIGGQTLLGAVLSQLNQTITGKAKLKFSLLAGSYDTFMAFAGLTELTSASPDFYGLPAYASTMAFEIFSEQDVTEFPASEDDLSIRFLFRNGTEGDLTNFPLFGGSEMTMSWVAFKDESSKRGISSTKEWCQTCGAKTDFCAVYEEGADAQGGAQTQSGGGGGISNAVAGVIGAMVTLGVVLILGLLFFLLKKRGGNKSAAVAVAGEKGSVSDGSSDRSV